MEWLSFVVCSAVAFVELMIAYFNPQQMIFAVSFAIFFLFIGLGLSILLYLRKIKHLLGQFKSSRTSCPNKVNVEE